MSKIVTLSFFLAKALIMEKSSYLFAIMAVVIMVIALGLGSVDIGSRNKLFEDVLLTSQGYLLLIAAFFYAFMLVSRDRNLGLFVLPIANGVSRGQYLAALMGAMVWVVGILFVLFLITDIFFLIIVEDEVHGMLLWQIFLYFLASLLAAFLFIGIASYVTLTNAVLYVAALFFIGNALDELYLYAYQMQSDSWLQWTASFGYYLLPNFSLFDWQAQIVNRRDIPLYDSAVLPLLYFGIWTLFLYFIALAHFRKKAMILGY